MKKRYIFQDEVGNVVGDYGYLEWSSGHITGKALNDFALLLRGAMDTVNHMTKVFDHAVNKKVVFLIAMQR